MAGYKAPDFNERAAASRAAKQSALDMLRNKAPPDPAVAAERQATRAARDTAATERRAARQRAARDAEAAKSAAQEGEPEAPSRQSPSRSQAELKAARDARYAARKARKR